MKKLEVNQTLFFVGTNNFSRTRGDVTVTAVGRKWAQIIGAHRGRIDVETLEVDHGTYSPVGRCYASEQDWLQQEGARIAWQQLRARMPWECPENLSLDAVLKGTEQFGIKIALPGQKAA